VIYPEANFARDSLVGMGLVLHRLAAADGPVSALARNYDRFHLAKIQRRCPAGRARALVAWAREAWSDRPVDLLDGVKVRVEDGWFIVRPSNTEPIVRVMAEGPTAERAAELAASIMEDVQAWLSGKE
jgi:phosphomannomutase